jgi:hypothetical protein
MSGLFRVRPGSIREVGDEAAGRGSERDYNSCPQGTDCVRTVHFLRDLAQPVLDADSHAKVPMRKKVRGLRTIEQAVLACQKAETRDDGPADPAATVPATAAASDRPPAVVDPAGGVVLDDCAAVRGILNDDHGGPLHPPGVRMAEALNEVQESIQRNLGAKKGGSRRRNSAAWPDASRGAWTKSRSSKRSSEDTSL